MKHLVKDKARSRIDIWPIIIQQWHFACSILAFIGDSERLCGSELQFGERATIIDVFQCACCWVAINADALGVRWLIHRNRAVWICALSKLECNHALEFIKCHVAVAAHCEFCTVALSCLVRVIYCDFFKPVTLTKGWVWSQTSGTFLFWILDQHLNIGQASHDAFLLHR